MKRICRKCKRLVEGEEHCGIPTVTRTITEVDIDNLFKAACEKVGIKPELVKGVRGMSSEHKIPERLEKGCLRAKYNLLVNKEGTIRFDSTDAALTHFKPKEIGISIETLKKLGYEKDIYGKQLESEDQILELLEYLKTL